MKSRKPLSTQAKYAAVLIAAVLHPLLLSHLYPSMGERANLVIVLAPFAAAWFFSFRFSILVAFVNTIGTAVVFAHLAHQGPKEGLPKSVAALLIVSALSFGISRLRSYIEKGRAMEDELDKIRNAPQGDGRAIPFQFKDGEDG